MATQAVAHTSLAITAVAAALLSTLPCADAHPSGLVAGRASCGEEYNTPSQAYNVYDIGEPWFLRRIQTCASPFFWTKFTTTKKNQPAAITVVTPQIDRFANQLQFRAVIFGNPSSGFPKLTQAQIESLPEGIHDNIPSDYAYILDTMTDAKEICDAVSEHSVMSEYNKLEENPPRCVENLNISDDNELAVVAGATWDMEFLYAKRFHKDNTDMDKRLSEAGNYWMVSWLERKESPTSEIVTGKYEITIGPDFFAKTFNETAIANAHEQVTTCTCGNNWVLWSEQNLKRIGMEDADKRIFEEELPSESCRSEAGNHTHADMGGVGSHSHRFFEWGARFELKAQMYTWTFQKGPNGVYGANDASIAFKIVKASADSADAIDDANPDVDKYNVTEMDTMNNDTIYLGTDMTEDYNLMFTTNLTANVLLLNVTEGGTYLILTQHHANEFTAGMLFAGQNATNPSASKNYESSHAHEESDEDYYSPTQMTPVCYAAKPEVDLEQQLEFAGFYNVPAGEYTWVFRSERSSATEFEYHEPQMKFYFGEGDLIEEKRTEAEKAIEALTPGDASTTISDGEMIEGEYARELKMNGATSDKRTTTFIIKVTGDDGFTLFTQHMPWEFAAITIQNSTDGNKWPVKAKDFVLDDNGRYVVSGPVQSGSSGKGYAPTAEQLAMICGQGTKAENGKCVIDCPTRYGREVNDCIAGKCSGAGGTNANAGTTKAATEAPTTTTTIDPALIREAALRDEVSQAEAALVELKANNATQAQIEDATNKVLEAQRDLDTIKTAQADLSKAEANLVELKANNADLAQIEDAEKKVRDAKVTLDKLVPTAAPASSKSSSKAGVAIAVILILVALSCLAGFYYFRNGGATKSSASGTFRNPKSKDAREVDNVAYAASEA